MNGHEFDALATSCLSSLDKWEWWL